MGGRVVLVYKILTEEQVKLPRLVTASTKPVSTNRTHRGLPTQSSVFGFLPRVALRVDYCRLSAKSKEEHENYELAFKFSETLCNIYKKYLPVEYGNALEEINATVHKDYRPQNTPFLTCNFNINHAIRYHRDSGNYRGAFSNVLILKKNVVGGYLVCPEIGITLSQCDRALTIFDGQSILHGVTPIKKTSEGGYRSSIVYYTLHSMRHCYPFQEELERLQKVKTAQAEKRLRGFNPKTGLYSN
jgi:hypothetical protein